MSSNDFLSQLIATFRVEAEEHLQAITTGLLAWQTATTSEARLPIAETFFREAHSLKGAARAVDLTEVEAVSQALEGVFARLKRGEGHLPPEGLTILHRALDTITAVLVKPEDPHATQVAEVMADLAQLEMQRGEAFVPRDNPVGASPLPNDRTPVPVSLEVTPPSQLPTFEPPISQTRPQSDNGATSAIPAPPPRTDQLPEDHPMLSSPQASPLEITPTGDDFLSKLIATFRLEADEHLRAMIAGVLALEKTPAPEEQQKLVETIFRETHSLKGAARAVDLIELEAICQTLESIFARLKRAEISLSPEGFDAIQQAFDTLRLLLNEPTQPHATAVAETVQRLTQLETSGGITDALRLQHAAPVTLPADAVRLPETSRPEEFVPIQVPSSSSSTPLQASLRSPADGPEVSLSQNLQKAKPTTTTSGTEDTIRVATAKLDSLFLQAEEMLAAKLSINQHAADLKKMMEIVGDWRKEWAKTSSQVRKLQRIFEAAEDGAQQSELYRQSAPQLVDFLYWNEQQFGALENCLKGLMRAAEQDQQTVGTMVDTLLESTKRVLTMPFSSLLEIFPKMVRDLSRSLGKEVELVLQGSEVEIDKRILEELKIPLIHLLRNSLDHGIEIPEMRERFAKPVRGTIVIAVSQTSENSVEIVISDDGGGINREKVIQAAMKKGLLSAQAAEALDEQAVLALIFQSELSTSPIVTDISGRGLGMAIVREKIEKLGGQIFVHTQRHEGTSFRIVVPLTLATFRGVFVEAAGRPFIVPTTSIDRVTHVQRSDIKTVEGKETIIVDGIPTGVAHLDALLEIPRKKASSPPAETLLMMILGTADKRLACCVDEIGNEEEVLFKRFGPFLSHVPNVAGATVLGSGKVVPILHVPDLLKTASEGRTHVVIGPSEGQHEESGKSVLIAEDSVTSRMLLKSILETAGYHVTTAVDGAEAYALMQKASFDLLVSDIEMPRMNGFELTAKVRSTEPIAQLPVVLVTGLDSPEDRERGITVGADAYIVKTSFDQSNLLDVVQRLI